MSPVTSGDIFTLLFRADRIMELRQPVRTRLPSRKPMIDSPKFTRAPIIPLFGRVAAVRNVENLAREVFVNGPRSSRHHLADHFHQHLLLYREDVVVANWSVRCGCGHRPSLHYDIYPDGNCVCGGAGLVGTVRVEIS